MKHKWDFRFWISASEDYIMETENNRVKIE